MSFDFDVKNLKHKNIESVGQVTDTSLDVTPKNQVDVPAVQVAKESDVFTANQLYGNSTNSETINKIGSSASLFVQLQSPQENRTNNTQESNDTPLAVNGGTSNIQRTALPSALTGVVDKGNAAQQDPSQILKKFYEQYNAQMQSS